MEEKIEIPYWEIPFEDENDEENPFALVFDLSEVRPGELELEDEIKMGYLWKKYKK